MTARRGLALGPAADATLSVKEAPVSSGAAVVDAPVVDEGGVSDPLVGYPLAWGNIGEESPKPQAWRASRKLSEEVMARGWLLGVWGG
jgi:hypothetical protein